MCLIDVESLATRLFLFFSFLCKSELCFSRDSAGSLVTFQGFRDLWTRESHCGQANRQLTVCFRTQQDNRVLEKEQEREGVRVGCHCIAQGSRKGACFQS